MHCFIWYLTTAALLTVTAAAGIRPSLSNQRELPRITIAAAAEPQRRGYQEQDTARAFYSYGYSDENAARAEYTTQDGSSRGFYSYVDANGKLQTVKYEAGGRQGFKAEGSNLPKAPVDDKKPPLPVTDTLEVQQARQAHLDAVREAEEEERREEAQQQQLGVSERTLSDEDADILERVRAELTSMLADRQREESRLDEEQSRKQDDATTQNAEDQEADAREEEREDREQRQQQQQMVARDQRLQDSNDGSDLRLRTVYTLADISSSSYLKLSDLEDRLDHNNQELRVPIGAYYSYVSPNAKYSVTTPTELRTLRPVALSRSLLLSKQNQNQN
ncbi:hypothetical protein KR044_003157 [Drosophila immigrans]|nr:hypothetical protein KR044_003157 [Drosophila immigrans]